MERVDLPCQRNFYDLLAEALHQTGNPPLEVKEIYCCSNCIQLEIDGNLYLLPLPCPGGLLIDLGRKIKQRRYSS